MSVIGLGYVPNTNNLFRAEMIPTKHHFWSFLAITIAVCQIQMLLKLIILQNEHDGMGYTVKKGVYKLVLGCKLLHRYTVYIARLGCKVVIGCIMNRRKVYVSMHSRVYTV